MADNVPYLDIAGVHDEEAGTLTFFAVNRHATETLDVEVALHGFGDLKVSDHQVMVHDKLEATNTLKDMTNVAPKKGSGASVEKGVLSLKLKPHSYTMIRLKVS